jgi:hypothetical protein
MNNLEEFSVELKTIQSWLDSDNLRKTVNWHEVQLKLLEISLAVNKKNMVIARDSTNNLSKLLFRKTLTPRAVISESRISKSPKPPPYILDLFNKTIEQIKKQTVPKDSDSGELQKTISDTDSEITGDNDN